MFSRIMNYNIHLPQAHEWGMTRIGTKSDISRLNGQPIRNQDPIKWLEEKSTNLSSSNNNYKSNESA